MSFSDFDFFTAIGGFLGLVTELSVDLTQADDASSLFLIFAVLVVVVFVVFSRFVLVMLNILTCVDSLGPLQKSEGVICTKCLPFDRHKPKGTYNFYSKTFSPEKLRGRFGFWLFFCQDLVTITV